MKQHVAREPIGQQTPPVFIFWLLQPELSPGTGVQSQPQHQKSLVWPTQPSAPNLTQVGFCSLGRQMSGVLQVGVQQRELSSDLHTYRLPLCLGTKA